MIGPVLLALGCTGGSPSDSAKTGADTGAPDSTCDTAADSGGPDSGGPDSGGPDSGAETGDPEPVVAADAPPDFSLLDQNPNSVCYNSLISPRDTLEQVSGWYFTHAT